MDASIVTAVAALTGAAIGGFTSVLASWLTQHAQAKAQRLEQDQLRRQEIYKEFIKDAAKLYIDALQSDKADVSALMGLYAEVSRMRVLSSASVIDRARVLLCTMFLPRVSTSSPTGAASGAFAAGSQRTAIVNQIRAFLLERHRRAARPALPWSVP